MSIENYPAQLRFLVGILPVGNLNKKFNVIFIDYMLLKLKALNLG